MKKTLAVISAILATASGLGTAPAKGDTTDFVIEISVDGLGSAYLQSLISGNQLPNFKRLQDESAWTNNARNDPDFTVTLPNHVSMVTGRGVVGDSGHGWTGNTDPAAGQTIHSNKGAYVASVFDVVHDMEQRTGLFVSKTKLSLIDTSYNATYGADDAVVPPDNGRDKIDTYVYDANPANVVTSFISTMTSNPLNYSLIHLNNPDAAGSWGSTNYNNAVKAVDGYLGQIFNMIDTNPTLRGRTSIILTADHGGEGNDHSNAAAYLNYTIPFFIWGPDSTKNVDLYAINATSRTNPGTARPGYTSAQPIRNSGGANMALDLLDLPSIAGSTVNAAQDLDEGGHGFEPRAPEVIAYTAFNEVPIGVMSWAPGPSDTELGFATQILDGPWYSGAELGTYDSATSPRRLRMRGYEAETVFDAVDLTSYEGVTASIDILIKDTTYEADDYYRAVLTNGVDTIVLADVQGTALNSLAKLTFLHYEAMIPNDWTQAILMVTSHTNSSQSAEAVDLDHIFYTGVYIPEPLTLGLLVLGGVLLVRRR